MSINNIFIPGTIFKNDNGEDYVIIAIDTKKDIALLLRSEPILSEPFYVGAVGLREGSWCHGHYFMDNFKGAFAWFKYY